MTKQINTQTKWLDSKVNIAQKCLILKCCWISKIEKYRLFIFAGKNSSKNNYLRIFIINKWLWYIYIHTYILEFHNHNTNWPAFPAMLLITTTCPCFCSIIWGNTFWVRETGPRTLISNISRSTFSSTSVHIDHWAWPALLIRISIWDWWHRKFYLNLTSFSLILSFSVFMSAYHCGIGNEIAVWPIPDYLH